MALLLSRLRWPLCHLKVRKLLDPNLISSYSYRPTAPLRPLHAQWSVLLSHEWHCPELEDNGRIEVEVMDEPFVGTGDQKDIKTILLLHGAQGTKEQMSGLAEALVQQSGADQLYQVLSCDLRGHGESALDDYAEPHTIAAVAGDIVELISACCLEEGSIPAAVVAAGCPVAHATALAYLQATMLEGGATATISYEASGLGAIPPPKYTFLLEKGLYVAGNLDTTESKAKPEKGFYFDGGVDNQSTSEFSKLLMASVVEQTCSPAESLKLGWNKVKSQSVNIKHLYHDGNIESWCKDIMLPFSDEVTINDTLNIRLGKIVGTVCQFVSK